MTKDGSDRADISGGLAARILFAWRDLRGSVRALAERNPSEGYLLFLAMLSGLFWFLSAMAVMYATPPTIVVEEGAIYSRIGAEFAGALIFRTLGLYVVALAGWGIARACGGTGSARDSRTALFWASLVAGPLVLAMTLGQVALAPPVSDEWVSMLVGQIGMIAFIWATAENFSELHGFRQSWPALAVLGLLTLALLGTAKLLQ